MGEAYLLRVYADTSTAGYYSPLHPGLGCATLLPVPDPRVPGDPPEWLDPWRTRDPCTGRPLAWYMPLGGEWVLHRDPRLDLGFYTEPLGRRGRLPRRLGPGWVLVFAAGLAVYPEGFWTGRRRGGEILSAYRRARAGGRAGVYIIGLLFVEEVLEVRDWSRAPGVLWESPHRLYGEPVRAVIGEPLLLEPPVPVSRLMDSWLAGRLEKLGRGRFRHGPLGPAGRVVEELLGSVG